MPRETLGEFEHQILLAIMRLGGEAYSVTLVAELEECTGREVAQAAVFIALRRLERKRLLKSRIDKTSIAETGRVRRYFKLTSLATTRLRESRRAFMRLWDGITTKLDKA